MDFLCAKTYVESNFEANSPIIPWEQGKINFFRRPFSIQKIKKNRQKFSPPPAMSQYLKYLPENFSEPSPWIETEPPNQGKLFPEGIQRTGRYRGKVRNFWHSIDRHSRYRHHRIKLKSTRYRRWEALHFRFLMVTLASETKILCCKHHLHMVPFSRKRWFSDHNVIYRTQIVINWIFSESG